MYVLIFKDEEDQTSNLVIDWLLSLRKKILVLNDDYFLVDFVSNHNGTDFIIWNNEISLTYSEISSYWLRRGNLHLPAFEVTKGEKDMNKPKFEYLKSESYCLFDTLMSLIYEKYGIGKLMLNETNKLFNLFQAQSCQLSVPNSFLSHRKNFAHTILSSDNRFCTKAIRQGWYRDEKIGHNGPTKLINKKDLDKLEEIAWPSLLQEYQEKKYELRIFYLDGDFYTSAIFSQNDEQTKVDFRNYNQARPNRTPPYQLPKEIEKKLHKLMQKLTIKCGSIDMVVNTKNEFVFLEVNPFGQFQQVSFPCNYYLELKVAEYLTKYDKTEEAVC